MKTTVSTSAASNKVRVARVSLASLSLLAALAWGAAAWLLAQPVSGFLQLRLDFAAAGGVLKYVPILAAAATCGALLWRGRFAWQRSRAALWIEERAPELRYALITLIDPACAIPNRAQLESLVSTVHTGGFLRHAAARSLIPAGMALVLSGAVFAATPYEWRNGLQGSQHFDGTGRGGDARAEMPNRIASVTAEITPPPYTKLPRQTLTDPLTIAGVVGTRIVISGRGSSEGIVAGLGEQSMQVQQRDRNWAVEFALPERAAAFTLVDRQYKKVIVVDPHPDLLPDVKLLQPETDTTLRTPSGSLRIEARMRDDFGIARARIEYIVSSGEGEGNITSRTGSLGARALGDEKEGRLCVTVPYSYFELQQGDVLSISSVAYDGNNVTGPGKGRSETRNIRIARASEYDALAITPAPPVFDKTAMSLRMLIIATEKLLTEKPRLKRATLVERSLKLGAQAETIRQKLQTLIDEQRGLDAGVAAIAADPRLMEAMSYMWEGVRALNVAEPGEALPPLRRTYRILKELADTAKYYLRGAAPAVIVNIERVRLTGEEPADAKARRPRSEANFSRRKLMDDYARAVGLIASDADLALELFMTMQVTALRESPPSAEALGKVIAALHAGDDVEPALRGARQAIEGTYRVESSLPEWSNSW